MSFAFFAEGCSIATISFTPNACLTRYMPMHPGTSFPGGTDWEVALSSTIKSAASGLEATAKVLLVGLRNLDFSSDQ